MINFRFLQKFFIFLFIGVSMCTLQACNEDEDEKMEEIYVENKREPLTLFKRWYLTEYSMNFLDLDWRTNNVVSWWEYQEFSKDNTLHWNSRMGGENTTYELSGICSGNLTASSFSAVNISDPEDSREFLIESLTEKYLLLYDKKENLHRAFVASDYAKFPSNSGNNDSGSDDEGDGDDEGGEDDEEDDEEDEKDGEWRICNYCDRGNNGKCPACHGDGTGALIYGTNEYKDCEMCEGSGLCQTCYGEGRYWYEFD